MRTAFFVFDMTDSSQTVSISEPFFGAPNGFVGR